MHENTEAFPPSSFWRVSQILHMDGRMIFERQVCNLFERLPECVTQFYCVVTLPVEIVGMGQVPLHVTIDLPADCAQDAFAVMQKTIEANIQSEAMKARDALFQQMKKQQLANIKIAK